MTSRGAVGEKSLMCQRLFYALGRKNVARSLKNLEESQAVALLCQYKEPLSLCRH